MPDLPTNTFSTAPFDANAALAATQRFQPRDATPEQLTKAYADAGGATGQKPEEAKKVGECTHGCDTGLRISVKYARFGHAVKQAKVKIAGPTNAEKETDDNGIVEFKGINPGGYTITVTYTKKNALVDKARAQINSKKWSYASAHYFGANTYKCNAFVAEMMGVGNTPKYDGRIPRAGEWATQTFPGWSDVSFPEPGDIVSHKNMTKNASGHVGIVSYPKPVTYPPPDKNGKPSKQNVPAGQIINVAILMELQSVNAGKMKVQENSYGFNDNYTYDYKRRG